MVEKRIINSEAMVNEFFKGKKRTWKIIKVRAEYSANKKSIYVTMWFPTPNTEIKIDFLKIHKFVDDYVRIALVAYIQLNIMTIEDIDKATFDKWDGQAAICGYDPDNFTRKENEVKEAAKVIYPDSHIKGFLYSYKKTLEYKPEKLLQHNMVVPVHRLSNKQTLMNDCLPFAVNMLLRHEFFC